MDQIIAPTYKKLTPFKRCVLQNFPFIEQDFDALTNYGLLCKIVEYLNNVISSQNQVTDNITELNNAFIELKDYVDNYFKNLDVQEEINNKLDEMAEDGTLAEIVGDYLEKKVSYFEITSESTLQDIKDAFSYSKAKVISFDDGNYTIGEDITITSNTEVLLNNAVITFSGESLIHGFNNYYPTDEYLEYQGNSNIKFIGGTIIGGAVSFCHAKNIVFEGVSFKDCNSQHILEMMAINGLTVKNCRFEGQTASEDNYREMIQIDDCSYDNFPWFDDSTNPTYDGTPNKNWTIEGCYFGNSNTVGKVFYTAIGGHTYIENSYHTNIIIRNNEFDGYSYTGVRLRNVINAEVTNNTFKVGTSDNTSDCVRGERVVTDVVIKDNIFNGDDKMARAIYFNTQVTNMVIEDNKFFGFKNGQTITDDDCIIDFGVCPASVTIKNNEFYNDTERILFVHEQTSFDGTVIFTDNIIRGYANDGYTFRLYRGSYIITNNDFEVTRTSGQLIRLHANTTDVVFKGNNFTQAINENIFNLNNYAGSFANIEDVYFQQLNGNYSSVAATAVSQKLNEFNTLLCVFGSGSDTQIMKVRPFNPRGKLSSRTYKYAIYDGSNNQGIASITLDVDPEDNTFAFTKSASDVNLRVVYLLNEKS